MQFTDRDRSFSIKSIYLSFIGVVNLNFGQEVMPLLVLGHKHRLKSS